MESDRPVTTLFMLMSVDGKISTGATDTLDFDRDLPGIPGVREGLHQYYEIEQSTDLWSLNTGRVQAKLGVNTLPMPDKTPVSFVLLDNHHLTERGIDYFCARSKDFVLVTSNPKHPAMSMRCENLHVLYQPKSDLGAVLRHLRREFNCERLTIQSGGTMNARFLRERLIDYADIVVAPVFVGGAQTATLMDGPSLLAAEELDSLGPARLISADVLADSYLRLRYCLLP